MTVRINAGLWRGRKLAAPADRTVRPTSDRARIALFNILAHGSDYMTEDRSLPGGVNVIDLFAGSGALGLEALSRGAAHAVFVENDRAAARALADNIRALDCADRTTILSRDAADPGPASKLCGLALLDPPYGSGLGPPALGALRARRWLSPGAVAVLEVAAREAVQTPAGFALLEERVYGAARLVFLRLDA